MKRKIVAIFATLLLVVALAPVASASVAPVTVPVAPELLTIYPTSCPNVPSAFTICLYEDANQSGDVIGFTWSGNGGDSTLVNNTHQQAGLCSAFLKVGDNWNDCVSSVKFRPPSGDTTTTFCFYHNADYVSQIARWQPQTVAWWYANFDADNDELTSMYVYNVRTSC